ncbi:hypothetical protein [Streptomyces sp. NBC_01718]|uniref:hypothetical protein n=1 Tax=Streptomyces sp. NBC_01718 TaxID=2975919 RepID=UPI00352C5493
MGALGYLTHRHPVLAALLMVAMGSAAVLAACIVPIGIRWLGKPAPSPGSG